MVPLQAVRRAPAQQCICRFCGLELVAGAGPAVLGQCRPCMDRRQGAAERERDRRARAVERKARAPVDAGIKSGLDPFRGFEEELMNETAIVSAEVVEAQALTTMDAAPGAVLAEAQGAAVALRDVIARKPRPVVMNGEQYLEFEDWQTLGRFYGVTSKVDGDPEYVQFGAARGFKASAVALHRGAVISRATALCLDDEEKWGRRPKYEWHLVMKDGRVLPEDQAPADKAEWKWEPGAGGKNRPKRERVLVGEEAVPLYQLASMAQTRACAKALRNVLSWVAVLAGYRPTPAEEMDGVASRTAPTAPKAGESRQQDDGPTCPKCGATGKPSKYPSGPAYWCPSPGCKVPGKDGKLSFYGFDVREPGADEDGAEDSGDPYGR